VLEEQRLDSKRHDRAAFDCGIPELNHYLTRRATQDRRRNLTQVYVLVDTDTPSQLLGYYTLSGAQVNTEQVSEQALSRASGWAGSRFSRMFKAKAWGSCYWVALSIDACRFGKKWRPTRWLWTPKMPMQNPSMSTSDFSPFPIGHCPFTW
jgi:hypothetical protein